VTVEVALCRGGWDESHILEFYPNTSKVKRPHLISPFLHDGPVTKRGLLRIINSLPSTLEAPHCGERSTAV
jgi:hypothetical protein